MTRKFGWSLPPGAANDPTAPYNQRDEPIETCRECGQDYPVSKMDEGELQGTPEEGQVVPYYCPDCGSQLTTRLVNEPEGI